MGDVWTDTIASTQATKQNRRRDSAASFAATVPFEAAQRLEEICQANTLCGASEACMVLEEATAWLRGELAGFVARMEDSKVAAPTTLIGSREGA